MGYSFVNAGPYELYHHGVKGQKWGVRRYQNYDGTLKAAGKNREKSSDDSSNSSSKKKVFTKSSKESTEKKKTSASKELSGKKTTEEKSSKKTSAKKISEMTDSELKEKIARLELEKKYKDLSSDSAKKEASRGQKFVYDVLEASGKNIATQTTTVLMGETVNRVANAMGYSGEFVNPKKGQKDK